MRVWLINHYALPPSEPGWTRHYALARELIRSGHDVTIIASSFNHVTGMQMNCAHEKLCTFERFGEVPFLLLRVPPYRSKMARLWNMFVFAFEVWSRLIPDLACRLCRGATGETSTCTFRLGNTRSLAADTH